MKLFHGLALCMSMIAPAVAHNQDRSYRAISPVAGDYSQNAPATRSAPTLAQPDTSVPDVIVAPQDDVPQIPPSAGTQSAH